jgi:hypothetical protein
VEKGVVAGCISLVLYLVLAPLLKRIWRREMQAA